MSDRELSPEARQQLAELWNGESAKGATTPSKQLPSPPPCGIEHITPKYWRWKPDRYGREGYQRAECAFCGRFIGYRPPETPKRKAKR